MEVVASHENKDRAMAYDECPVVVATVPRSDDEVRCHVDRRTHPHKRVETNARIDRRCVTNRGHHDESDRRYHFDVTNDVVETSAVVANNEMNMRVVDKARHDTSAEVYSDAVVNDYDDSCCSSSSLCYDCCLGFQRRLPALLLLLD
jgi:hypothetical protein